MPPRVRRLGEFDNDGLKITERGPGTEAGGSPTTNLSPAPPKKRGAPRKEGPVSPMTRYLRRIRVTDPEKFRRYAERDRSTYERYRKEALSRVARGGPIRCGSCGCDDDRVLQIEHARGGGAREVAQLKGSWHGFYIEIAKGRRAIFDLKILCQICNSLSAVEMKNPDLKGRFKIAWF